MLVLLSLVLGCDTRCPTFDELEVRLPDDGESPTVPERAELAISNFRSWTTLDGVCVDTLRVGLNQTEWEHRAWLNDGRDQLRISPTTRADQVYGATMHGLCHAADEALGGLSETRPDLFDHPIPGSRLTRQERMRENFANACARGPGGDSGADVDGSCDPTLAYRQKRFLLETVFDAVEDVDTLPLLPFVLGEEVPLRLPEGLRRFELRAEPRGVLVTAWLEERWVLQTYSPITGERVHELVLEEAALEAVWWELALTTGERTVLVRTATLPEGNPADPDMSAWELGQDGTLTRLGASERISSFATVGVVEPRGLWEGSGDNKLFDLNTGEVLGTASSLLGVTGSVFGAVGANLRVYTEDGSTLIVGQDGTIHLTVPPYPVRGSFENRIAASSDGYLLQSFYLDDRGSSVIGLDADGDVFTLATGCGASLPPGGSIETVFEVDGAPFVLARYESWSEVSVYPLLPMP